MDCRTLADMESFPSAVRLAGDTWVFPGVTNSGWRAGCLVDTGPDPAAYDGRAVEVVLVTHGHADHFSAAAALRAAGARVVAAREEVGLVENPEVNIRGMFSWAKPSEEMVTKLFCGQGCPVDVQADVWYDSGVRAVPLPGHTLGHTGFLTVDGVLFTGDALYEREVWARHPLPYAIDIGLVRASLRAIDQLDFEWLVPGHGEPMTRTETSGHVSHHLSRLDALDEFLLEALAEPKTTEETIALVCRHLDMRESPAQYWLAVTSVRSFLVDLMDRGLIRFDVRDYCGSWARA